MSEEPSVETPNEEVVEPIPNSQSSIDALQERFGGRIQSVDTELGAQTIHVARTDLLEVARYLKEQLSFEMPIDCTAIDWMDKKELRFEVVYQVASLSRGQRLRIKVAVSEQDLSVPSLTPIWRGMNWNERETFDMYGIRFTGHPKLERILMYEEFVGHPLRKDYPVDKQQPLIELRDVNEHPTQRKPPREMLNRP